MRALALLLALLFAPQAALANVAAFSKPASGVQHEISPLGVRDFAGQPAEARPENAHFYGESTSGIVDDPINHRDPTGRVVTREDTVDLTDFVEGNGKYTFTRLAGWVDRSHFNEHIRLLLASFFQYYNGGVGSVGFATSDSCFGAKRRGEIICRAARSAGVGGRETRATCPSAGGPMNRDGAIALAIRAVAQLDTAFENSQAGNAVSAGILEEIGRKSSYSLEDLPSNRIGVEIARRFLNSLSEGDLIAAAASGDPASYLMEHNAAGLLAVQKSLLASLGNYVGAQKLHDLREPHSVDWVDPATGAGGTGGRSAAVWFRGQSNASTSPLWHPLFAPIDRSGVPSWLTANYGSEAGCSFGVFDP